MSPVALARRLATDPNLVIVGSTSCAATPRAVASGPVNSPASRPRCHNHAMGLVGIHHVSINVDDVDAALAFYVNVLGLSVRRDRPEFSFGGAWLGRVASRSISSRPYRLTTWASTLPWPSPTFRPL